MTHEEFIKDYLQNNQYYIENDVLYIKYTLWLEKSNIKKLPNNVVVQGGLDLLSSDIIELPNDLQVGTWLDIGYTSINKLPDNLKISGDLYINKSEINFLPKNLHVGTLYMSNTKIQELPDDLYSNEIITNKKLIANEKLQLRLIQNNEHFLKIFKDPTEKAKTLQKLLWEL